jgi:hypothetical protein
VHDARLIISAGSNRARLGLLTTILVSHASSVNAAAQCSGIEVREVPDASQNQSINTRTIATATPMKNPSTMMRTNQSMLVTIYTNPWPHQLRPARIRILNVP